MKGTVVVVIVLYVFLLFGTALFQLMPYLYARNTNIGIGDAFLISIKYGLKYVLVFMVTDIVISAASFGLITFAAHLSFDDFDALLEQLKAYSSSIHLFDVFFTVILSAVSMWVDFTAVYIILEREKIFDGEYDYTDENDMEEEEPFIEPYDFFIEADERFSDERVSRTPRKVKKMFGELSFEIGEYDTYNGGRSIENSFTEEIDEREFEVSVEIARNSDYEPFVLTLRVNLGEE